MCYLKNLGTEDQVDFDDLFAKHEEPSADVSEQDSNVLIPCAEKQSRAEWSEEQQMLINLFELIERNNHMILGLSKVLAGNSQEVEKNSIQIESRTDQGLSKAIASQEEPLDRHDGSDGPAQLKHRLFGHKNYKYSLRLISDLPSTLYKERNFNLGLQLVDGQGKVVRNCNLVNLCFAVCTSAGEWVHENKLGEAFMKGKTEVELYKGEASFVKLYARDVSRNYPDSKINLAVYAKPTTLLYSGSGSYETAVRPDEIEPLILQDVTIKAKKKD